MSKARKLFTNWRVIMLIVFLLFAAIAIQPHFFGERGVSIRSVTPESSAALGGIENPPGHVAPLSYERITSIDGAKILSVEDYVAHTQNLLINSTVRITTNKATYTLVVGSVGNVKIVGNGSNETQSNTTDNDILGGSESSGTADLGLRIANAPTTNLRKGLDLEGGTRVLLKPAGVISDEDLESTIGSLQERLNVYGLSDVVIRSASDLGGDKFIIIEIAGVTEQEVKELLAKQGKFEATIGDQVVFSGGKEDITYVCRSADCSGIDPRRGCARSGDGYACSFFFGITLSADAAARQAAITRDLPLVREGAQSFLNESLVLYLDNVQVDSLRIAGDLKGRDVTSIQITGSGTGRTQEEAVAMTLDNMKKLQTVIITGSLPVTLNVEKADTISPSLGKEFTTNVIFASLMAILAVIVVILIRYREWRIVLPMSVTLVSEIILLLGFAAFIGWNLDLAAIAGIIIVAGTAVDHLVIITDETLRREVTNSWMQRIKNAMLIVFGAYCTTLSGMLPLLGAGAGLLKGFALTTIAGLSFGVLIARPAYAAIIEILLNE